MAGSCIAHAGRAVRALPQRALLARGAALPLYSSPSPSRALSSPAPPRRPPPTADEPAIPTREAVRAPVEAGRTYKWCACGRSAAQPWCDGAHAATSIRPVVYTPTKSGTVSLCGCKHTGRRPFCDGASHNHLPG
jgi:CDGSH-type Zn-finger protein